MNRCAIGVLSLVALAGSAHADFSFTPFAGPYTVGNTTVTINANDLANSAGVPAGLYSSANVTVAWGNSDNDAWSTEAVAAFNGGSQVTASSGSDFSADPTTLTWTGLSLGGLYNPSVDGTLNFNMRQTYVPSGADWSNIVITLVSFIQPPVPNCIDLGSIASGVAVNFNTESTTGVTDTEVGVYNQYGQLLGSDDDSGTGNLSSLNLANLPDGTYYIAVGTWNTTFGGAFGVTSNGTETGMFGIEVISGMDTLSGSATAGAAPNNVQWFCVTIPTPSAAAMLGLGGLVAIRRRRA